MPFEKIATLAKICRFIQAPRQNAWIFWKSLLRQAALKK
jgi:hypothetical protein